MQPGTFTWRISTRIPLRFFSGTASGNVAPLRTIVGPATGLNAPIGLALDSSGNLYVSNSLGNSITVYSPGANSNTPPARTISGNLTSLNVPQFIAVDSNNRLYVSNFGAAGFPGFAVVFSSGANGNATPAQTVGPISQAVGMSL
jgi:hypothetical protein